MLVPVLLLMASPAVLGVLLGVAIGFSLRRQPVYPERPVRIAVGLAAALLVAPFLFDLVLMLFPFISAPTFLLRFEWRFLLPLVLGMIALFVLLIPLRRRQGAGKAELERRTPFSFVGPGSVAMLIGLTVASIGVALFGGLLSGPDDVGNYTMFWIEIGSTSGGTTIYGWYYSIPALATLLAVLVLVAVNLVLISGPPFSGNAAADIAVRKLRVRASLWLASGAIAMHLSEVFVSLAATSTSALKVSNGSVRGIEPIVMGTSFSAMTPVLWGAWAIATVVGMTVCVSVLLSIIPVRTAARSRMTA